MLIIFLKNYLIFSITSSLFLLCLEKFQAKLQSFFSQGAVNSSLSIGIWVSSAKSSQAKSCQDRKGPLPFCAAQVKLKSSKIQKATNMTSFQDYPGDRVGVSIIMRCCCQRVIFWCRLTECDQQRFVSNGLGADFYNRHTQDQIEKLNMIWKI